MAQKFVTLNIPAYKLRVGDVIRDGRHMVPVRTLSRWNKHATDDDKRYHTGCRGVHVNGSACWEADALLQVTRQHDLSMPMDADSFSMAFAA